MPLDAKLHIFIHSFIHSFIYLFKCMIRTPLVFLSRIWDHGTLQSVSASTCRLPKQTYPVMYRFLLFIALCDHNLPTL